MIQLHERNYIPEAKRSPGLFPEKFEYGFLVQHLFIEVLCRFF
jgi:hypothetical protein